VRTDGNGPRVELGTVGVGGAGGKPEMIEPGFGTGVGGKPGRVPPLEGSADGSVGTPGGTLGIPPPPGIDGTVWPIADAVIMPKITILIDILIL